MTATPHSAAPGPTALPVLRPGDLFATANPMALGRLINAAQWFWSKDGVSEYSHTGIITHPDGRTFEALWTNRFGHLDDYQGHRVLIARIVPPVTTAAGSDPASGCYNQALDDSLHAHGLARELARLIDEYHGRVYPLWRLGFHLIPPLARLLTWRGRWLVCSELVAKYLHLCGARHGEFTGTNPETLVYEWIHWRRFVVIYQGVWPPPSPQPATRKEITP